MKARKRTKWLSCLLVMMMILTQLTGMTVQADAVQASSTIVLTLGADLTEEQKAYVLQYFGITLDQVEAITITNADERAHLGNLISEEEIGTRTLSCALVRPTNSGGIQVKTANMYYVTSNMIASTLSTSGVYNCEVLTVAPFEVSGTGALTGVMMAYETASGAELDPAKKELANEELVITGEIADTVGQDQATLVVNDIKIHIVRDQITDQETVNAVVDEVIETTEQAAIHAAAEQGKAAPATLGQVERETLYNFGYKFSQMGYRYADMQATLERVTHNITTSTGIDDPIVDTFTTIDDNELSPDSILLGTEDDVLGDDAIINATNTVAVGDHPAEPIEVFAGEVTLTEAGGIKAERFISKTNIIAYKDLNGSYALMDLNGNILTDSVYSSDFYGYKGYIQATLSAGDGLEGLLASDGIVAMPFEYNDIEVISDRWAIGIKLVAGTEADYDYYDFSGNYYQISAADVYYLGTGSGTPVGTLTREQYGDTYTYGDYLNICDRSGVITTYDVEFNALQNPEYLSDFGNYNSDELLSEALSDSTGYSVGSFYGSYARAYDGNTGKYGIMDRYGNMIIPAQFDNFHLGDNTYMAGGYFAAEQGEQFVYVTAGGTVTGSFSYNYMDVYNYGMSAKYEAEDGSISLLAGDGKETSLGTTYEYVTPISESKGMLWEASGANGYDLLDWHGNVLISGSDDYSVSANGNYVIAQNGYTSSTLYLVNDASPVKITETAGGASELEVTVTEGASLEAYTATPTVELVGNITGTTFADNTHLILTMLSAENATFGLSDLQGNLLTNQEYSYYFTYEKGWLISEDRAGKQGLVTVSGIEAVPCQYDLVKVLNENWAVGYTLVNTATEDDNDFYDYDGNYYYIDQAVVFHLDETEISAVTLTRDQIADIAAEEDYLNVQDRTTGAVTTYNSSFEAVASVNYISEFSDFSSSEVLAAQIKDSTGLYVSYSNFPDGYSEVSDYSSDVTKYGVMDMSGNLVVPVEYDNIMSYYSDTTHFWCNGYFGVEKDGMAGYVTQDGTVTCELKYPRENFYNYGMAGYYDNGDGTKTLVAADGTEVSGFESLSAFANGLFWRTYDKDYNSILLDWHGNVIFSGFSSVDVSYDGKYIILLMDQETAPQLYAVDGAVAEGTAGNATEVPAQTEAPAAQTETPATEVPATEAPNEETEGKSSGSIEDILGGRGDAVEETQPAQTEAAQQETQPAQTEAAQQETQPAQTEAAQQETQPVQTEVTGTTSAAGELLNSASALMTADAQANSGAVLVLLQQAKAMLDSENPSAATIVGSAITLLESGATDASSVLTLITTAQGML